MNKQKYTKVFQHQIEVTVKSLVAEYSSSFNFKISLKRANKQMETKTTLKYETPGRKEIEIGDDLSLITTFNAKNEEADVLEYNDKIYKMYLQVYTKQGFKSAASAELNLGQILNQLRIDKTLYSPGKVFELEFAKHPFSYLRLKVIVNAKFLAEIDVSNGNLNDSRLSFGDADELNSTMNQQATSRTNLNQEANSIIDEVEKGGNNNPNNINNSQSNNTLNSNTNSTNTSQNRFFNNNNNLNVPKDSAKILVQNLTRVKTPEPSPLPKRDSETENEIFLMQEDIKVLNRKVENMEKEKKDYETKIKELNTKLMESNRSVSPNPAAKDTVSSKVIF
jgi:hypothetical protein